MLETRDDEAAAVPTGMLVIEVPEKPVQLENVTPWTSGGAPGTATFCANSLVLMFPSAVAVAVTIAPAGSVAESDQAPAASATVLPTKVLAGAVEARVVGRAEDLDDRVLRRGAGDRGRRRRRDHGVEDRVIGAVAAASR